MNFNIFNCLIYRKVITFAQHFFIIEAKLGVILILMSQYWRFSVKMRIFVPSLMQRRT